MRILQVISVLLLAGCVYGSDPCEDLECAEDEHCELEEVPCIDPPRCPLAPIKLICVKNPCAEKRCEEGEECEEVVHPCLVAPCPWEAVCVPLDPCEEKRCEEGEHCKVVVNPCLVAPCLPEAICVEMDPCGGRCGPEEFCEPKDEFCADCVATCRGKVCTLPKKEGPCEAAIDRFYYDATSQVCREFKWGGCESNGNNFENIEDCRNLCRANDPCEKCGDDELCDLEFVVCAKAPCPPLVTCRSSAVCSLPKDVGPCDNAIDRYYYDSDRDKCKKFTWGGCDSNGNNFENLEDCRWLCGDPCKGRCGPDEFCDPPDEFCADCVAKCRGKVCTLPKKEGPCEAAIDRFYYDPSRQVCREFKWGGCDSNGNNFENVKDCRKVCRAKDPCKKCKRDQECELVFVVCVRSPCPPEVICRALSSAEAWRPQHGTTLYPKLPELSPQMKTGDYYLINDEYYRAMTSGNLDDHPDILKHLPQHGAKTEYWQHIPRGTFIQPKVFNVDTFYKEGDVYIHEKSYYRARESGKLSEDIQVDISNSQVWKLLEVNPDWMSLLRPIIGDLPLGDLVIPGCHDAGTWGIDENSILVDQNFLFQLADELTPETVANWSLTHEEKFDLQLSSGFRNLDLRVADVDEVEPGVFRWWHGMTSDEITEGLQHIGDFARTHTEEILVLDMQHFASPGNAIDPVQEIRPARKDVLSDLILQYLGDRMAPRGNLPSNPTMNEVLATGANIITVMKDDYIRAKDDRYWDIIIHSAWSGVANPEDLFNERSAKLENYHQLHSNEITDISGCVTPDEKIVVAGLMSVYGDNETIREILEEILPQLLEVDPANMSYEGLWLDLLNMADYGTNTLGMRARAEEDYTNGASVHYDGVNGQLRHWVARPDKYKPNIIYTDGFLTSTFVTTAVDANRGDIPREVTIAHQGNTMNGFYTWDSTGWSTLGGDAGLECQAVDVRYTVLNQDVMLDTGVITQIGLLDLQEGTYPLGAVIELEVRSPGGNWRDLWSDNIQQMIDSNNDVYVRGTDLGNNSGFAYLSSVYNDFGVGCNQPPADNSNILASTQW